MTNSLHDAFFKEIYSNRRYSLDIFRLTLSEKEFDLFDWKTLKSEATVFMDKRLKEKRMDLVFSTNLKKTRTSVKIVFLLEHKSGLAPDVLQQLLHYQTCLYDWEKNPVIPILIYHGQRKAWRGHVNFQDTLKGMKGVVKKYFKDNVLNFKCRFLNIQDMGNWKKRNLTTLPIFFIMSRIWNVNEKTIENFFKHLKQIGDDDRRKLQELGLDYIHRYDNKSFSWEILEEIERKVLKKGDRIMPPLKYSLQIEREEGHREGRQEGESEGRQKERQKMAMAMLRDCADIRMIERYTKLTRKQIEKLKKELK